MGRLSKRVINRIKITITKKRQTMKKNLFKTRLLSFAAFCGFALAFASCANEDVAQGTTGTETENDKNLTTFVAGDEAKTRTSMDYNTGAFYWEAGDYIYVKDDDGTWQRSDNAPTGKVASFKFKVPGKFSASNSYKVYYPGKFKSNDQVTIPDHITQDTPNKTDHLGASGDCGTADASKQSNGSFAFALDHQAAILVFQPYTNNSILRNCYLTKIEVTSDNDITGTYTLDPISGELTGTGSGKQISLVTRGLGTYYDGFPLTNSSASINTNGAYMVIKPGTHKLRVRYWLYSTTDYVQGTITKTLSAFNYAKNTYYDMTANLDVKDYDGDHYYMWDAQKQYWDGYEWTRGYQPTVKYASSSQYPQNSTDPRYKNTSYPGPGLRNDATTALFKTLPNANEMSWYCMYGDAHNDRTELWSAMGHLHKGGLWFKKKAILQAEGHYDTEVSADGTTDMRTTSKSYNNNSVTVGPPSPSDVTKYFFLPALGGYQSGQLNGISGGNNTGTGHYWSSSAYPFNASFAYLISFADNWISVYGNDHRFYGYRVQAFE